MERRRQPLLAASLVVAGVLLTGCAGAAGAATNDSSAPDEPARVVRVAGSSEREVVLTADAARRVAIRTEPIERASGASGQGRAVIRLAAVLYDKDGKTWAYTLRRPLTFVRQQVVITHIDGDTATISSGPAAGTQVVTQGGAELLGVEYGVPGE
jgi:membrane protein implicated in regulation of membrane protease activity